MKNLSLWICGRTENMSQARGRSRSDRGPKNQQVGGSRTQSCNMSFGSPTTVLFFLSLARKIPSDRSVGAERIQLEKCACCPLILNYPSAASTAASTTATRESSQQRLVVNLSLRISTTTPRFSCASDECIIRTFTIPKKFHLSIASHLDNFFFTAMSAANISRF